MPSTTFSRTEIDPSLRVIFCPLNLKEVRPGETYEDLEKTANMVLDMLNTEALTKVHVAFGTHIGAGHNSFARWPSRLRRAPCEAVS